MQSSQRKKSAQHSASAHLPEQARCLNCGHLLRGLPEQVCPECGCAFDPNDSSTFEDPEADKGAAFSGADCMLPVLAMVLVLICVPGLGWMGWPQLCFTTAFLAVVGWGLLHWRTHHPLARALYVLAAVILSAFWLKNIADIFWLGPRRIIWP